jgi:hypothetical protein
VIEFIIANNFVNFEIQGCILRDPIFNEIVFEFADISFVLLCAWINPHSCHAFSLYTLSLGIKLF